LGLSEILKGLASQRIVQIHAIVPAASITTKVELMFKTKRRLSYPVLPSDYYWHSA